VGSLTLHLDEDNFLKGTMQAEEYDSITSKFENLGRTSSSAQVQIAGSAVKQGKDKVNIGGEVVSKLITKVGEQYKLEEEEELKGYLLMNYQDYLNLKQG